MAKIRNDDIRHFGAHALSSCNQSVSQPVSAAKFNAAVARPTLVPCIVILQKMGDFKVHQVRFFDFVPGSVHCMAYGKTALKLALSRSVLDLIGRNHLGFLLMLFLMSKMCFCM